METFLLKKNLHIAPFPMSTQKLKEIHIGSYDRVRNNVDKILKALDTHGTVKISGLRRGTILCSFSRKYSNISSHSQVH